MADDKPKTIGVPQIVGWLVALAFKLTLVALALALPLVALWVASSLAVFANRGTTLAIVVALLLFPVLPALWELWAARRRARRKDAGARRMTRLPDRLFLRTFFLSVAFLGVLVATRPEQAFLALSTRGDWFLDGRSGPVAGVARRAAFGAAASLEWLYRRARPNPYKQRQDTNKPDLPKPVVAKPDAPKPPQPVAPKPEAPKPDAPPAVATPSWPAPAQLHPAVAAMPASAEVSIDAVAQYLASAERDPLQRVKALHDYVADRIAYDVPALALPRIPAEDAEAEPVFKNKKGVCAGYASLLAELGKRTGDDIRYLVGDARQPGQQTLGGTGHAWNAARVDGRWYLMDPTWDAGFNKDGVFEKRYSTSYLFTPPEVFGLDHLPEETEWQLRETPLSAGEFLRQPMMTPAFFADGFELLTPKRPQISVERELAIEVKSAGRRFLQASATPLAGGDKRRCEVMGEGLLRLLCPLDAPGQYQVTLWSGAARYGTFSSVGRIDVNRL